MRHRTGGGGGSGISRGRLRWNRLCRKWNLMTVEAGGGRTPWGVGRNRRLTGWGLVGFGGRARRRCGGAGKEREGLGGHVEEWEEGEGEYSELRQSQHLLMSVGRPQVPADLALKLKIALSRELALAQQPHLQGTRMLVENAIRRFM